MYIVEHPGFLDHSDTSWNIYSIVQIWDVIRFCPTDSNLRFLKYFICISFQFIFTKFKFWKIVGFIKTHFLENSNMSFSSPFLGWKPRKWLSGWMLWFLWYTPYFDKDPENQKEWIRGYLKNQIIQPGFLGIQTSYF